MGEFDWTSFIENLWDRENAQGKKGIEGKGGFRGGKYSQGDCPLVIVPL